MLMATQMNGQPFATIAIRCEGEVFATAFDLRTAGRIADALRPGRACEFVPVFSGEWHYDEAHKLETL